MKLLIGDSVAAELDDLTFKRALDIYPEEEFSKRPIFESAIKAGEIQYEELKAEAAKLLIPWQMFLLDSKNLDLELARIEKLRHKASARLLAKRPGIGTVTSKRILDRLIRCQTYIAHNHGTSRNVFCGSLKGRSVQSSVNHIKAHFGIDLRLFRRKNKADALAYLVERFEDMHINISQGVLTNKLLPHLPGSRSVYKQTSGFIIHDDCFPFVFLPSEINPDERDGRQIFTLVFLIALIGLDAYDYQIERDFKVSMLRARGRKSTGYKIASELLMPSAETERLRGTKITLTRRDELAHQYKLTATAVIVILRKRALITATEYDELLPGPAPTRSTRIARTPAFEKSVRKFNGRYSFEYINKDFSAGKLSQVQTQYLLFGGINKKAFKSYRNALGL